jgi:hypothetical protein
VRSPLSMLDHLEPTKPLAQTHCTMPPSEIGRSQPAPGPAAGLLVATHFVYSMALKRKRSFRAFAWDAADGGGRNRTAYPAGRACWRRSQKALLFSHTFLAQTQSKAVICAMPSGDGPECACCVGLKSLEVKPATASGAMHMESTSGQRQGWNAMRASRLAQGCNEYQAFWD